MIRGKEQFLPKIYAVADFIVIQIALLAAWFLKFEYFIANNVQFLPFETYLLWSFIYGVTSVLLGFMLMIYSPKRRSKFAIELAKIVQIQIISMFMLLSMLYIFKVVDVSRSFLVIYFIFSVILLSIYRLLLKQILRSLRAKGYNKQFILILGAGTIGKKYYANLLNHPEYGLEVIGFLDDFQKKPVQIEAHSQYVLGEIKDLETILANNTVDEVVIALPIDAHKKYKTIIAACEKAGVRTTIIPDFYDVLPAAPNFELFGDLPIINVRDIPLNEIRNRICKRMFDILVSLIAIIITLPVMVAIILVIKLTSPGPVIFKQERVGLNRRTFYMYKFRSMKHIAENQSNTVWTVENDPRRTKFGTFIRKTSLDELPQFFNVLKGDMSVVGPRPERPFFVEKFKEDVPQYMIKHHVRPGITGWAQVCGYRGDTSIPNRITHDIFYIENWTILFDLKILILTLVKANKNAY